MSETSRSNRTSRKSGPVGLKTTLSMFAPASPIVVATTPSAPGFVQGGDDDLSRIERLPGGVEIPAYVEPLIRLVVIVHQRRRMDGIDGDPLPRRADADDPFPRHGAAFGRKAHRHVPIDAAQRQRRAVLVLARNAKHEMGCLGEAEPAAFVARQRRAGLSILLEIGVDRADDVGGIDLAAADADEDVVDRRARQPRQRALEFCVAEFAPGSLERAFDDLPTEAAVLRFRRLARRAANRGAGASRDDETVPGGRRRAALRTHDQHFVAVVQGRNQRRDAAVDFRADRGIADIGVHGIGEIDRGRAARQARSACPFGVKQNT